MNMISVIIPSYNRKELMLQAVESVLHQSLPRNEYEIIVVKNYRDYDDVLREKGVRTYYIENSWFSAKLSKGIEESEGDIICFLDDDDLFKPNKLEKVKRIFEEYNISWFKNTIIAQDLQGNILDITYSYNSSILKSFSNVDLIEKKSMLKIKKLSVYLTLAAFTSTQCVSRDVAFSFKDKIIKAERYIDELIFFFSIKYGNLFYIDKEPLTIYRVHENNISRYNKNELGRYASDFYKAYKAYDSIMEYFLDDLILKRIIETNRLRLLLFARIYDVFITEKINIHKVIKELIFNPRLIEYDKGLLLLGAVALMPSFLRKGIIKLKLKLNNNFDN